MPTLNEAIIQANALLGGGLVPLGYQQVTGLSSAKGFTVPASAVIAIMNPVTQNVRWRDDGTNPDASTGMQIVAGEYFTYTGDLSAMKFIEETTSAEMNVSYYRGP